MKSLPYDSARRFAALHALAEKLPVPRDARVLDVGGYPGTFARELRKLHPEWRILTVDTVEESLEHYQAASGAELPFVDGQFELVFSSDVLEHVPPSERSKFLKELCRVCSGFVLIGAPFDHPAVREVENSLNNFHRAKTGRPHPWLGEHVENGLPNLKECLALFPSSRTQAVFGAAPLHDWLAWQWSSMINDIAGQMDEPWKHANELWTGSMSDDLTLPGVLSYRHIIVSQPKEKAVLAEIPQDDININHSTILALNEMMRAFAERMTSAPTQSAAQEIDARLQRALELAEAENARLRGELAERKSFGLFKRKS